MAHQELEDFISNLRDTDGTKGVTVKELLDIYGVSNRTKDFKARCSPGETRSP